MSVQLAQLNVARVRASLEDPLMADFADALDRVNALADASPGFVWRWVTPEGDTSEERVFGAGMLVNLSVWQSVEALRGFAYAGEHLDFLRRRREWFLPLETGNLVLWWVPAGHIPALEEAAERLALLDALGPMPRAFTLREHFPAPADGLP
jgi:hypothetical protein